MLVATRILPAAIKPGKPGSKAAPHYRQDSTRLTTATDLPIIRRKLNISKLSTYLFHTIIITCTFYHKPQNIFQAYINN